MTVHANSRNVKLPSLLASDHQWVCCDTSTISPLAKPLSSLTPVLLYISHGTLAISLSTLSLSLSLNHEWRTLDRGKISRPSQFNLHILHALTAAVELVCSYAPIQRFSSPSCLIPIITRSPPNYNSWPLRHNLALSGPYISPRVSVR